MLSRESGIIFLIVVLLGQISFKLNAQTEKPYFQLDSIETGSIKVYRAKNYVQLKKNFSYKAIGNNTFRAFIDTSLVFYIKSIENPSPNNPTDPSSDCPYTPGGSFGNDQYLLPVEIEDTSVIKKVSILPYPALWFKTIPYTNNLNGYYQFKELANNGVKVNKISSTGTDEEFRTPRTAVKAYNFNPAIDLSSSVYGNAIITNISDFAQSTVIAAWAPKEQLSQDQFIFAIHGRRDENMIFTKNKFTTSTISSEISTYGTDSTKNLLFRNVQAEMNDSIKFKESALRIATAYKTTAPGFDLWGEANKSVIQLGGVLDTTKFDSLSTYNSSWHNYPAFKGYTPELLFFNKVLSDDERNIFETYLAIKYGITLNKSYCNRNSQLVWDYENNKDYNYRITGYAREDAVSLNQLNSTTAYEEFSTPGAEPESEAYDSCNSYHSSSRNKLLIAGIQPGNTLINGQYYIFGDNDDSLKTSHTIESSNLLKRKWKLTAINQNLNQWPQSVDWTFTDLEMFNSGAYKYNIVKRGNKPHGVARTTTTLMSKNGYFAWKIGQEYGPVTVKFGTSTSALNSHENDYGYHITKDGQVKTVEKGIINAYTLFTVEKGQRIEIEKYDRLIFLRVNSIRYKLTEIIIDSTDMELDFYGSVVMGNNPYDVWMNGFRTGGFCNNGHRIEFSYGLIPDLENAINENIFLVIDKSGNGTFDTDVEYFPCDEIDLNRKKLIFNNIFWDTDGNKSDVFTFGYASNSGSSIIKKPTIYDDEPELIDDISIYYPEPENFSKIIVKIQSAKPSPGHVQIFDIAGKLILRRDINEVSGVHYEEISLDATGIYIVKAFTTTKRISKKVISKRY